MRRLWVDKMRALLCVLFVTSYVLADKNDNRRNKLPFVADAVGNSLPPPSSLPATVGSPVNLLTPDRYEFYTFDESGELVKKLMTLEEIQAIVAAGEEGEGLVTFANDNQPTMAFNFSQPPYTKVHSVVTNVQNVLKAQMEAHKNKPHFQPTLDTPDVSDSWSLILPSIFGNTGVDIVPDKSSGAFTTPETETIQDDHNSEVEENSLSKEDTPVSSSTKSEEKIAVTEKSPSTLEIKEVHITTATPKVTTTSTTPQPTTVTTTTKKSIFTSKPSTITTRLSSTTRRIPDKQKTTTNRPRTTTTTEKPLTTSKPIVKTTVKMTTTKTEATTNIPTVNASLNRDSENSINVQILANSNSISSTEKNEIKYEKLSTFIPVSTVKYVTERTTSTTPKPTTTRPPIVFASTTKRSVTTTTKVPITQKSTTQASMTTVKPIFSTFSYISSTRKDSEIEKANGTTITTQSVSPSTTMSSTEFLSAENLNLDGNIEEKPTDVKFNDVKDNEPILPMFDVAQSISQIASDLGGNNYQPIPTTSNLLETTNMNVLDLESKENLDIDIPTASGNETENKKTNVSTQTDSDNDNFVKISTFDPHDKNITKETSLQEVTENNKNNDLVKPYNDKTDDINETNDHKKDKVTTGEDTTNNTVKISVDKMDDGVQINKDKTNDAIKVNKNNTEVNRQSTQKLEITTTIAEETTIDPILSESMGDLLLQVANEAPQSIVDSEKDDEKEVKITTTEKSVENTTFGDLFDIQSSSEPSIKVKKETTSTTTEAAAGIVNMKEPTNHNDSKIGLLNNITMNKDSNVFNINSTLNLEKNPTLNVSEIKIPTDNPTNTEDIERGDVNFVQIAMFSNKNETEEEPDVIKPENRFGTGEDTTETKENGEQNNDASKTIIQSNLNDIEILKVETTDHPLTTEAPTTTTKTNAPIMTLKANVENKISPSKFNNINAIEKVSVSNKKDRIPEPLPKIDDFKKKIQKVNIAEEELISERNNSWKLVPTLSPAKVNEIPKDKLKSENHYTPDNENKQIILEYSQENQGLEVTTRDLGEDIAQFTDLCNELAFRYWNVMVESIDKRRSFVLSPYSITSMLAMMFMGARGATSGEMNEILKLDDMVTFNPHFTLKNISDSIETTSHSGVAVSAFIRELYSDRTKGKILTFYKERAQHFYNGHVEEINFKLISDIIRRRTNLLVKRYTWGKIAEYMKTNDIMMQPPLAAFSANIFQTDCTGTSVDGRDGEMYFIVSPNVRQRRLVPVPAVVYKRGFMAGYDPVLDATAAALGNTNSIVSTIFVMPSQQGNVVHADDLEKLEQRLLDSDPTTPTWSRLLRTLLPRTGVELQIPRFSHKSIFNVSSTLQKMGLKDLFDADNADLGGLNGPSKDLYLSDMIQQSMFVTCGEGIIGEQHHIEEYPEKIGPAQRRRTSRWVNDWDEPRDYQRAFHDPHDVGDAMNLPLHLRPRQARLPSRSSQPAPRLKYDRPFLFFVRHNPSGMILYFGRYNPRLLP